VSRSWHNLPVFSYDVSLLHGLLPVVLDVLALSALTIALIRPDRRWWLRRVLPVVALSICVAAMVNWLIDLHGRFGEVIPLQFIIYAAMPLAASGLAVCGWPTNRRWRRNLSVVAIPLTLLCAANLVNQQYGYAPTIGALVGSRLNDQVSSNELQLRTVDTQPSPPVADPPAAASTSTGAGRDHRRMQDGAISQIVIPGALSHFAARPSWVWVPPVFFEQPRPHLPVIVILAGTPGEPDNMIRAANADTIAEGYADRHQGVAPIIVFADGNGSFTADTECVDSRRGNAETYLSTDLPRFVTEAFSTLTGPSHWAIEGYSEGGTCAMVLALAHPDVYGSFVDIAGDRYPNLGSHGNRREKTIRELYDGNTALFDAHDPTLLIHQPAAQHIAGWFEAGNSDRKHDRVATELDAEFRQAGLDSRHVSVPGGHDFGVAARAIADSFDWLCTRIGS
jgi:S-formylglutathione hydrolase FrmB